MLIYQNDSDVLALFREAIERLFDLRLFCFPIANQEVLLRVGRLGDMSNAS